MVCVMDHSRYGNSSRYSMEFPRIFHRNFHGNFHPIFHRNFPPYLTLPYPTLPNLEGMNPAASISRARGMPHQIDNLEDRCNSQLWRDNLLTENDFIICYSLKQESNDLKYRLGVLKAQTDVIYSTLSLTSKQAVYLASR